MGSLTKKEQDLISLLGECFNQFSELGDFHPSDLGEFVTHIHILQRQVMARLARREHPEMFSAPQVSKVAAGHIISMTSDGAEPVL